MSKSWLMNGYDGYGEETEVESAKENESSLKQKSKERANHSKKYKSKI